MTAGYPRHELAEDGMALIIRYLTPEGTYVVTLHRQPGTGPFTEEDVAAAIRSSCEAIESGRMQPGQRNRYYRMPTRFGTLWTYRSVGPPTWWLPKAELKPGGFVMVGWLRLCVAAKFEFDAQGPPIGPPVKGRKP